MVNAEPPRWKLPSDTRTFRGLVLASLRCGVPVANNTTAISGLIAAALCFFLRPSQWLSLRHGSIDVNLADLGLRTTDKTWHYEQWLHLEFAGRKRRRDVSPADSKSRHKIVFLRQELSYWRCSPWMILDSSASPQA